MMKLRTSVLWSCWEIPRCWYHLISNGIVQADLVIFPFMERFELAMPIFSGYHPNDCCSGRICTWLVSVPENLALPPPPASVNFSICTSKCPNLCCFGQDAMRNRAAVQYTMADRNLLLCAFKQHGSVDFFDYHSYALGQLHPHLIDWFLGFTLHKQSRTFNFE